MPAEPKGLSPSGSSAIPLIIPIILVNLAVFIAPMVNLSVMSFREIIPTGGVGEAFSLEAWHGLFSDSYYLELIWRSIWVSLLITALTLVCSYPIAWYLHRATGTTKALLLVLVIAPLLTSAVVRTYGWIAVLGDRGLISMMIVPIFGEMPRLIYNMTGVIIGLTEIQMPYMILALLVGLGRIGPQLEEAAETLGARPARVFTEIIIPLSLPGVALGCLFSFVHCVSAFVTPRVLGGGRVNILATEIFYQSTMLLNWPVAAMLSIVVLAVFGLALAFYSWGIARLREARI